MLWRYWLIIGIVSVCFTPSAKAGFIFGKKKPKVPATKRVPELIYLIRTSSDSHKRQDAVDELQDFSSETFPEIIPVLVDVLLHDKSSSVRSEAAQTLGKIRPITQQAGWALEKALDEDDSMRVRLYSRSALLKYHWLGYGKLKNEAKEKTHMAAKKTPLTPPNTQRTPPIVNTHIPPPVSDPNTKAELPIGTMREPFARMNTEGSKGIIVPTEARPLPVGPVQPPLKRSMEVPKLNPVPKLDSRISTGPELERY